MFTIQKARTHVQQLQSEFIPTRLGQRFRVGVEALGLSGFTSLNSNGRLLRDNRHTGESLMRRIVSDERLPAYILKIIVKRYLSEASAATGGALRFSLDHSKFGQFYIAVLAVSIGKGRALPVWCIVTRFKGGQLLKPLIRGLQTVFTELSQSQKRQVTLTMDRWFGIPELLTWLDKEHISFIVRMKAGTGVEVPWQYPGTTIPIGEISDEDTSVTYAGHNWRLVRSDYDEAMKEDEPWFLLTNIPQDATRGSRRHILNLYAARFQIEEFFKDIKWIQRYKWVRLKKKDTMRNMLLFAFLGWWILGVIGKTVIRKNRARSIHPKKRLSWFREVWEYWQRLRLRPVFLAGA